jgi:hypothetical protein
MYCIIVLPTLLLVLEEEEEAPAWCLAGYLVKIAILAVVAET